MGCPWGYLMKRPHGHNGVPSGISQIQSCYIVTISKIAVTDNAVLLNYIFSIAVLKIPRIAGKIKTDNRI
jgi:hypothetical protein